MFTDANTHLSMFTEFVLDSRLDDELRELRFADFARIYNGPAYRSNAYDTKMLAAYKKYQKEEDSLVQEDEPESEDIFWQPVEDPQPGSFAALSAEQIDIIV
jgi:deoxycytidine triphosphate deaminase